MFLLPSFLPHWSRLRSIEIINSLICAHDSEESEGWAQQGTPASRGLFADLNQLQHIRLQSGLGGSSYRQILSDLPPSLRTLEIDDDTIYAYAHEYGDLGQSITDVLLPVAPQLTRLTITDTPKPNQQHRMPTNRGSYDDLIRRLVNIRELIISPCAVRNLAESLHGLSSLRTVRLVQGFGVCTLPLEPSEVVQFSERLSSVISINTDL